MVLDQRLAYLEMERHEQLGSYTSTKHALRVVRDSDSLEEAEEHLEEDLDELREMLESVTRRVEEEVFDEEVGERGSNEWISRKLEDIDNSE